MKAVWWKARGNRGNTSRGISEDASGSLKTGWTILHEMKESREWWHWGRRGRGLMPDSVRLGGDKVGWHHSSPSYWTRNINVHTHLSLILTITC